MFGEGHKSTEKSTSARNRILSVETYELEPWAAPPFRLLSTGRCLHRVTVHCLASREIGDISSKGHGLISIDENGACRPRLAPQCLHSQVTCMTLTNQRRPRRGSGIRTRAGIEPFHDLPVDTTDSTSWGEKERLFLCETRQTNPCSRYDEKQGPTQTWKAQKNEWSLKRLSVHIKHKVVTVLTSK